jgi:hypothetical protein
LPHSEDTQLLALVRFDPDESNVLLEQPDAHLMEMGGRRMPGWIRVDADAAQTKKQLSAWVECGVAFARSLPPKH